MTLNILFFTITIKKRVVSGEEALREQLIENMYEETKLKALNHFYRLY